jgi:hypothetical protein
VAFNEAHWPEIEAVANELLDHGPSIDGGRVESIVGEVQRPKGNSSSTI